MLSLKEQQQVAKLKKDIRFDICAYIEKRLKHIPLKHIKATQRFMDDIEGTENILGETINLNKLPVIMVDKYILLSKKQYVTQYHDLINEFGTKIHDKTDDEINDIYEEFQEKLEEEKEAINKDISFLLEAMKIVPRVLKEQNKTKKESDHKMINVNEIKTKIYKEHAEGKITLEQREEAIISLNAKLVQEAEEMDAKKEEKDTNAEIDKAVDDAGTKPEAEKQVAESTLIIDDSPEEKFNMIRSSLYDKVLNHEISVAQRERVLDVAMDKYIR